MEDFFRRIVQCLTDGMGLTDRDGVVQYVNPALAGRLDLVQAQTIAGRSVVDLYDPETRCRLTEEILPAVRKDGSWRGELLLLTQTGPAPTMNSIFSLGDRDGTPTGFVVVVQSLPAGPDVDQELRHDRLEQLVAQRTAALSAVNQELRKEIEERERAEQQIARGKALLEAVILQSPIPMVLASSPDMIILIYNEACRNLFGKEQPNAIGRSLFDFLQTWRDVTLDGKEIPLTEMPLAHALRGRRTERAQSKVIRKDGQERLIEVDGVPIYDRDGQLIAGFIAFPDITDRKRAEDLLRAQHDLAVALTQSASLDATLNTCLDALLQIAQLDSGGIYLVDEDGRALHLAAFRGVSHEFAESAKYLSADSTRAALMMEGKPFYPSPADHGAPMDPNLLREGLRLAALLPVRHQGRVVAGIGVGSHCDRTLDPAVRSALEATASQVGSAIAHASATERLRRSEERYRSFVANAAEGIYRIDFPQPIPIDLPDKEFETRAQESSTIGEVNETLARMLGFTPDQVAGRLATAFTLDCGWRTLQLVRAPGHRISNLETTDFDRYGRPLHFIENTTAIVEDGCLVRIWGTKSDITERKRLEEQLRQAQKMEAIGRLAGGIAHDFNNIMTGINGYAEIMLEGLSPGDPLRADLEQIRQAGERAASLTNQLLAFSRKQVIAPRVIDPNQAIERSQNMLRRIISEDIDLSFRPASIGRIKADPAQLDQVLVNLALNARDAMPDGGKLTIETASVSLDEAYCKAYPNTHPGDFVMLAVSDTGRGMDEETLSRIFEPFFTTKEKDKGTGLGLAMVYGIVYQNNGFINVYSEVGMGSTFKIYLPRVLEEPDQIDLSPLDQLPRGTETILLVEDEEMVRSLTSRILAQQGYTVIEARDGGNAYLLCSKHAGTIHLLLTDVVMPMMNGRQLYEKLVVLRPGMKVLYMSGYTEDVIAHHGVIEVGTDFIQKPFTIYGLAHRVRQVLDGP